jgi:ornithine--oxo-acid transaminase
MAEEPFDLGRVLRVGAGRGNELYARHSNPLFVRMLEAIGFDRDWERAEGAYLYDRTGTRYLDWLGGFGMFNVGRNNPVVVRALTDALAAGTPSLPQLGLSDLPGILAAELVRVSPPSLDRVVFVNSGTEAVEAAG